MNLDFAQSVVIAEYEAMARTWNKRRAPVLRKDPEYEPAMLEQLVIHTQQRQVDVVVLELPANEAIIAGRFDWAREMYVPRVQELAERYGVAHLDFSTELGLGNGDFYGLSHLVEPGRELWEQRLGEELAAFCERQGDAGAGDADGVGGEP